ncbi:hypothetical protein [Legionella bozemanae]|uniref:hypothetical protein n=1 Tax=Legionella bozemanae TaxID=447 RepID=UPI00399CA901
MKNQQLRAIYTDPEEIFSGQTLLEQVKEFAEIGFNESFRKYIESNKKNIKLFASATSKYSKEYLDFLNATILALSSAKKNINTLIIRDMYAENQHYSRQPKTKHEYPSIEDIEDSTLNRNVIKRLDAFKKQLEAIRNQQLILQAQSLVKLTNADIDVNQENLRLMKVDYLKLCSNYSQESFAAFERKFARFFGEKSISAFRSHFAKRKLIMDGIMEACKGTPAAEVIRKEQSELDKQINDFELIMRQAAELKDLKTCVQQIRAIENVVTEKAGVLLIPSDAKKLQELIEFIEEQEKEIQRIKEGINSSLEIHQHTKRAIEEIEQSIRQKKEQAGFFLQKLSHTSSEASQRKIEGHQVNLFPSKEPSTKSDQKNEEVLAAKKERLQEAIALIQAYRNTIEKEQKRFSVKFFHKSRNEGKISYCQSLEKELQAQDSNLNSESNLHDIINNAHGKAIKDSRAQAEITKGGSYFGTSRMLSLQRLLSIDEAWKTKGHSKFLVFSTQSDFHGLKIQGVVGDNVHKIVEDFYLGVDNNSNEECQRIKEQAFPKDAASSPQCY